jgi:hypothetical protein
MDLQIAEASADRDVMVDRADISKEQYSVFQPGVVKLALHVRIGFQSFGKFHHFGTDRHGTNGQVSHDWPLAGGTQPYLAPDGAD